MALPPDTLAVITRRGRKGLGIGKEGKRYGKG